VGGEKVMVSTTHPPAHLVCYLYRLLPAEIPKLFPHVVGREGGRVVPRRRPLTWR
jgi:hypothetical protein